MPQTSEVKPMPRIGCASYEDEDICPFTKGYYFLYSTTNAPYLYHKRLMKILTLKIIPCLLSCLVHTLVCSSLDYLTWIVTDWLLLCNRLQIYYWYPSNFVLRHTASPTSIYGNLLWPSLLLEMCWNLLTWMQVDLAFVVHIIIT